MDYTSFTQPPANTSWDFCPLRNLSPDIVYSSSLANAALSGRKKRMIQRDRTFSQKFATIADFTPRIVCEQISHGKKIAKKQRFSTAEIGKDFPVFVITR